MKGRNLFGIILITLGIGIILEKLQIFKFGTFIGKYWPAILILILLIQLISKTISFKVASFLIIIAAYIQLSIIDVLPLNPSEYFWPILIILIGIWIISSKYIPQNIPEKSDDILDYFSIFSGIESKNTSNNFKGGNVCVIFGGTDLDLTQSKLSDQGAMLTLIAIFGGIDIKVPKDFHVKVSGIPIFGGWSNETDAKPDLEGQKTLMVKCLVIFGGIDITN